MCPNIQHELFRYNISVISNLVFVYLIAIFPDNLQNDGRDYAFFLLFIYLFSLY